MNNKKLQQMIEMLVESVLFQEKEELPTTGIDLSGDSSTPDDSGGADSSLDTADADSPATGGTEPDLASDASELANSLDGTTDSDTDMADDSGDSGGFSGGGGGGFGGGGGSFGSSTDDSGSGDEEASSDETEGEETGTPDLVPLDPIQDTIDMAVKLSQEIGDHQIILNVVKSKMQKYFPDFDEAIPVIQGLWDTNDPNLKIVARKLIMFIKGD